MTESRTSLIAMAMLTVVLLALGEFRVTGGNPLGLPSLAAALVVTLGIVAAWMRWTLDKRSALAGLALFNGILSSASAIMPFVMPALAGAAHQPQSDWLSGTDLTPPAIRWLRLALASSYVTLALLVAGLAFFAAAYLLFRRGPGRQRHAH